MSPPQTNKRRRDAKSVAGPSKRLRFVVSSASVTVVRTHADGTESTASLNGLPESTKRTREDEDRRNEMHGLKRAKCANASA